MRVSTKVACLPVFGLALLSGNAFANPVEFVVRLSVQSTGTTHVLVRFTSNKSRPPKDLTTFGTSHSDWFETGSGTSENTGSGVEQMNYQYLCDCYVPTDVALTYTSVGLSQYSPKMTATLTPTPSGPGVCDEKCPLAAPADAGQAGTSGTAGSSTQDTASDGGGSAAVVDGGKGGASGSRGSGSSQSKPVDESAGNHDAKGSACSFSPHGREGVLSLLLSFGLMALGLRRRR